MFCRQLREVFGQDNDIFIPMGIGSGVDGLFGCPPSYKSASNGKILSSIWESMDKTNCLNPIIVLDEMEKACYSIGTHDVNQNVLPSLLQLFGDENILQFKDNFFEVPIKNFHPNFIATANSLESIPEPLLNRLNVIRFRGYSEAEVKETVIPYQYESFKKGHNELVPDALSNEEIDIIYKMSRSKTRQIKPSINKFLAASFDLNGQRHQLDSAEVEGLLKTSQTSCEEKHEEKQIGFCR